jgi:uncharacterized protein
MSTYILFHAKRDRPFLPCIDGLCAAYAAKLAIPDAVLAPAMYGHPPSLPLVKGDRIFLLDLTYPAHVIESWADAWAEITILDHHKTALEDLSGLSDRISQTFDMKRSGAVIAWEYFHPDQPIPEIFKYVQDRDLWTKHLPDCDLISLGQSELFYGLTAEQSIALIPTLTIDQLKSTGETVKTEVDKAIAFAVANHSTRIVQGHTVPFFKCRTKWEKRAYSDIGNALMNVKLRSWIFGKRDRPAPFAVVQTGEGWALRSTDNAIGVDAIARKLGGGGHRNASGCKAE